MSKLRAWSGKYVNYMDDNTMWVRTDYVEQFRAGLLTSGRVETGETLVTGGKLYHAFVEPSACELCGGKGQTVMNACGMNYVGTCRECGGSGREWLRDVNLEAAHGQAFAEAEQALSN